MDRLTEWASSHGGAITAAAGGVVLGIVLSLPLGWKPIPDTISALIGSIAGAVGAIGGAFFLWRAQDAREQTALRRHILNIARGVLLRCETLQSQLEWEVAVDVSSEAAEALDIVRGARRRMRRLEGQLHKLDGIILQQYNQLEDELADTKAAFKQVEATRGLDLLAAKADLASLLAYRLANLVEMLIVIAPTQAEKNDLTDMRDEFAEARTRQ